MKKFSSFIAILGWIGIIAIAVVSIRYGAVNMHRTAQENTQWRLEWASRR